MAVKPIPDGYHSVTPHLCIMGAAHAINFYKKAFLATERMRFMEPGGKVAHAEIQIGDSIVMLSDEFPEMDARSPRSIGGSPVSVYLYVDDVDVTFNRAIAAGAKVKRPVADEFYGDRVGGLEDPFGRIWWISTHMEDLSAEEIGKRAAAAAS